MRRNKMKERKMVKWQPFASLPEQANYIHKVLYEMGKTNRPQLSEDQFQELNERVYHYYENKDLICLCYFYDGYIYEVIGTIIKIDLMKQLLIIENKGKRDKFSIYNIVDIELL